MSDLLRHRTPEDRLFLTYARTFNLARATELAQSDRAVADRFPLAVLFADAERCRGCTPAEFRTLYRVRAPEWEPAVRSYQIIFFLHHQQHAITLYDLEQLEAEIDVCPGDAVLDNSLLQCLRGHLQVRLGDIRKAERILIAQLDVLARRPGCLYGEYVRALLHRNLGLTCQHLGDFTAADEHLAKALKITRAHTFLLEISCNWFLGSLQWAAGQFREALSTHRNRELRELAARTGNWNHLLHSFVSAAKCALDAKETDIAAAELDIARRILAEGSGRWPEIEGYLLLYTGELEVQRENFERGIALLEKAQAYFEHMSPRHYPGILDAKIALCHFALYERDYGTAFGMIRRLMEEAEAYGCLEARSRLLLIEAYLFITEDPPPRAAYDRLLTRVHLIHNPTVLFRALANLYTYALEFLDESDQAFILTRLKNLRGSMTEGCFLDLYQRYVVDRYEYAIENRLARFTHGDSAAADE